MDVRGYIDENAAGFFDALRHWVTIPSISADPAHRADVRRSAEWLTGYLRHSGFPVAEIWETGPDGTGLPAVFAHWPAADPSAPVVLVYGHHDVQPVEPHWRRYPASHSALRRTSARCAGSAEIDGMVTQRPSASKKPAAFSSMYPRTSMVLPRGPGRRAGPQP